MPARKLSKLPKLYLHRGTGYWCMNVDGRRIYLSKNQSDAIAQHANRCRELQNHPVSIRVPFGQATVGDVIAAYLKWAAKIKYVKRGKPTGEVFRIRAACRMIVQCDMEQRPAVEFDDVALEEVQTAMADAKLARKEINSRIACIKRMFKWAVKRRLATAAAVKALLLVESLRKSSGRGRETKEIKGVPDEVIQATLPHLSPTIADMVRLQRLTGMRPMEICHLRPCDLDMRGDLWIYTVPDEWNKLAHFGIARAPKIGPAGQAILRPYLDRDPESYCFSPAEANAAEVIQRRTERKTPLCRSWLAIKRQIKATRQRRNFRPCYDHISYAQAIRRAIERANRDWHSPLPAPPTPWHPNQLRHSAGFAIRRQFGLDAVQEVLGHRNRTTSERYAEIDPEIGNEAMRKIG